MLDKIGVIFKDRIPMMQKLKKYSYEANMELFREKHGHFFDEMNQYMDAAEDKEQAARMLGDIVAQAVYEEHQKNGKVKGRVVADHNMFMIYYIFPAILLTEHEEAGMLAEGVKNAWNERFHENIGYTTYDSLYKSFNEKIMGIF